MLEQTSPDLANILDVDQNVVGPRRRGPSRGTSISRFFNLKFNLKVIRMGANLTSELELGFIEELQGETHCNYFCLNLKSQLLKKRLKSFIRDSEH
jgi:hypothetical protein